MQTPQKKKFSGKYDPQLKLAMVRDYFTTDLGYDSLAKKYDEPQGTVLFIIKWYKNKYADRVADLPMANTAEPSQLSTNNKELEEAGLKITALERLIENAVKELGIDLVKKFGTKQPKK